VDVQKKLDEIVDVVGSARSMPMSASCVVNRADLLAMLEEVREALPGSLAQAQELIGGHEQLAEQARQEAERIIGAAHDQRSTLISDTAVARRSQEEADRILGEARRDADEIRAEADDYVDSKLANFEVVLTKTIGSVDRGRDKLLGRAPRTDGQGYDGAEDDDAPEYSADPDALIRSADDYVDAKLGAFEAVLSKTLDAVGKGRQKLLGRVAPDDDLGLHMAAQDAAGRQAHTSDEDYLADLAEVPQEDRARSRAQIPVQAEPELQAPVQVPAQQPYTDPGYPQQAAGYQESGYSETGYAGTAYQEAGYTDPAYTEAGYPGYQQQDGYGYQPQDPYAYPQQGYDPAQAQVPALPPAQPPAQGYGEYGWQQGDVPQQPQAPHPDQESGLDETSLFDTSMIDLDQLRRYEQGH
jgi:cell division septum initiation protein DivIVA